MQQDATEDLERLWGEGQIRAFISHTHAHKEMAQGLQEALADSHVASFVAHEDITPLSDWQDEILKALRSMNVLVALLSEDFHESEWTDQEVGAALGRDLPILPIRMGADPLGFIRRYQGMSGKSKRSVNGRRGNPDRHELLSLDILERLVADYRTRTSAVDAIIESVGSASSFHRANRLSDILPDPGYFSDAQGSRLIGAYNDNYQANGAWELQSRMLEWANQYLPFSEYELVVSEDGGEILREKVYVGDIPFE